MPLYNGIFHEMSHRGWEYLPKRQNCHTVNYDIVFEYLIELENKPGESWFISTMLFIIGMNEGYQFKILYQKGQMRDITDIFSNLSSHPWSCFPSLTCLMFKTRIDLYNLEDIDLILEMIDMLNTGFDHEKFLMMKLTNG